MKKVTGMPDSRTALPGTDTPIPTATHNAVTGAPLMGPFGEGIATVVLGAGCFWGVERKFWNSSGVVATAVGYAGGFTPNPTYEEVCSGQTGHAEVVLVHYDTDAVDYRGLLKVFFECHDPTQGMRQGNDIGTQYRSIIFAATDTEAQIAREMVETYQTALKAKGFGRITTEIVPLGPVYYAEGYHQQYLHKNPAGYCGVGGTGVVCPL